MRIANKDDIHLDRTVAYGVLAMMYWMYWDPA